MKLNDLTGQQFGRLTVISRVPDVQPTRWLCRCICGKEVEVFASNLTRHHTTSCGCARGTGIIGRRVGKLVVIDYLYDNVYQCRCDCGNYCTRIYESLTQSRTMSCDQCAQTARTRALLESGTFVDGTQPSKLTAKPTKSNKSGVVGVNWDKSRGKWMAGIRFQGKKYNLGRFEHFEDAVEARKAAEKEIFGNFLEWYESHKQESPSK